MVLWRRWC